MGRTARPKPKFLPQKLLEIRLRLGLSQNEMLARLGLKEKLLRNAISGYELGTTEPSLPVILEYAKVAGICTDILLDDKLKLPDKLPGKPKHR
jgi:transcriptional regulator with XRE-family HTH domain